MVNDTIFEFEKKRDEAIRYNRNLVVATVQAMKRISQIRERRERVFWENRLDTVLGVLLMSACRMREAKAREIDVIKAEVEKNVEIISEPKLKEKIKLNIKQKQQQAQTAVQEETMMVARKPRAKAKKGGMNIEDM